MNWRQAFAIGFFGGVAMAITRNANASLLCVALLAAALYLSC